MEGTEIIGESVWSLDLRITHNPSTDTMPQVVADGDQNAHILWLRSGLWTQTVDRWGYAFGKEVHITSHVVRGYGDPDRYPLGPCVAIDSSANVHVTWDDGWQNIFYQKFDIQGNALTSTVHVGDDDNAASHTPSIAIDPVNDYVHIVHEDYQYQCEDIVYEKLDNSGKQLVNSVAVSSDVSAHCEHSTVTTDARGSVHVAFGTNTGTWWRTVDQNGMARGLSKLVFPSPPYFHIPDMAVTPNGDVHFVWTTGGSVHYTRMDPNGTVLNDNLTISGPPTGAGPPRISASHDSNSVHIVWHDYRYGIADVFYASMQEGHYGMFPENHQLTHFPAQSTYPDVAVDPDDNVHVVWTDDRDGNQEIYYKFMYNFKMDLAPVDVAELANMYFFHPGDKRRLGFYIENQGTLADGYEVCLSHDGFALDEGWALGMDRTIFYDVTVDERVFFNLTVFGPAKANSGDCINITLKATSLNATSVNRTLTWRSFIIVEKAVTVTCPDPTRLVDPGGTLLFDVKVTNIGDVPDMYQIEYSLVPDDRGWQVVMDTGTVMLDMDENMTVPVVITAPPDANSDMGASVYIKVRSTTDGSVWDTTRLVAIIDPTFLITVDVLEADKWVDPGGSVQYDITMRNEGTYNGDVEIYLSSTETLPGWTAVLSVDTLFLRGGEELLLQLTVTAPSDALAGLRQVIKVNAVSEEYSTSGQVEVTTIVNQIHELWPAISCEWHDLHPGEGAFVNSISVYSDGNGLEHVSIGIVSSPSGWKVHFEDDGVEITSLAMLAKSSKSFLVYVNTPKDALAGANTISLVLRDSSGYDYFIAFQVGIYQRFGFDLTASSYTAQGPPGGEVHYMLSLTNEGNGEDTYQLDVQGLPSSQWLSSFHSLSGLEIDRVTLKAGERRGLDLVVRVPDDTNGVFVQEIVARAISKSAEVDEVRLTLGVVTPDLKIQSIEYDPSVPRIGEPNRILVYMVNDGTYRADQVRVLFLVNEKEVGRETIRSINQRCNSSVVFTWSPSTGRTVLTFRVSCTMQESDYDNNEVTHLKGHREYPRGEDWNWLPLAVMAIGAVLLFLFIIRADYRDRARGP